MKRTTSFVIGFAFASALTVTISARARAAESTPPAGTEKPAATKSAGASAGTKAAATGKEVTLTGDLGCGKCSFKTTQECQNVLRVKEGKKSTMYYLAANPVSESQHEAVCSGTKPATVTGTLSEEGKGAAKKKVLVATEIKIN